METQPSAPDPSSSAKPLGRLHGLLREVLAVWSIELQIPIGKVRLISLGAALVGVFLLYLHPRHDAINDLLEYAALVSLSLFASLWPLVAIFYFAFGLLWLSSLWLANKSWGGVPRLVV